MERPKRPCSIYSRLTRKKNRCIYYAVFRDETGAYGTAVSTGCTRRDDAVRWCEAKLKKASVRSRKVTLVETIASCEPASIGTNVDSVTSM